MSAQLIFLYGTLRDERLEQEMASVQTAVSMGHALRKEHKACLR